MVRIEVAAIGAVEDPLAVAVDTLPLLVHDLVVLEQVLADLEVPLLDLLLRGFDAPRDQAALDPLSFRHAQPFEDALDPRTGEDPHQVIFQGQVEAAAARVALAAAAAAELQVDAPCLVTLGADDMQAAELLDEFALLLHVLLLLDLRDQRIPFVARYIETRGVLVLQAEPRPSFRGCRPERCRCRGRPYWWRSSRRRRGRPGR